MHYSIEYPIRDLNNHIAFLGNVLMQSGCASSFYIILKIQKGKE